jgi:hypothetical protein
MNSKLARLGRKERGQRKREGKASLIFASGVLSVAGRNRTTGKNYVSMKSQSSA